MKRRDVLTAGLGRSPSPPPRFGRSRRTDQDADDRRLGAAHRCRRGDRAQRQQRLHHRRDLHERRAGRRRDRRREVQDRAEAVRRCQRSGARHDADPAPDRRGHRFLPGLVRLQHRAADRGDHRAGEEADGADRRRLRRDLHPRLQVRRSACSRAPPASSPRPRRCSRRCSPRRRPIRWSTPTTPSPRPRPRACGCRAMRRASSGSTASSCRPSRPTCRACWARCAPTRRTCWSASCTIRIRSWWRARWSPATPT